MSVYVNRNLNMEYIKAIGFDMDYTLVRYRDEEFELESYKNTISKLVDWKKYPEEIKQLKFDYDRVVQGIVIDKKKGNLLKVSRFGKVKSAYHGLTPLDLKELHKTYSGSVIDLTDGNIESLDTCFSISNGVLFAQLVDLRSKGVKLPEFHAIAEDVHTCIDLGHRDGSLKGQVLKDLERFIIREPELPPLLEHYKRYGKKLLIITNSDFHYTKRLLDFTITPFLKEHKCWSELFDITITYSQKPRFFNTRNNFFKVDHKTGLMSNTEEKIEKGVFQGGCAEKLQEDLNLKADEILYIGDHIYGDVIGIKKTFSWRTALVVERLATEVEGVKKSIAVQKEISALIEEKSKMEQKLNEHYYKEVHEGDLSEKNKQKISEFFKSINNMNDKISNKTAECRYYFNPYWGEVMQAGTEESRFADQIEKYACVYMTKVSDLLRHYPFFFFRPIKRVMPHEY